MPNHYSSLYKSRQISRSNQFSRLDNIYVIHSLNIGLQKIEKQRHEHSTKYLIMLLWLQLVQITSTLKLFKFV